MIGVEVRRFPASMTGAKLRNQMGLEEPAVFAEKTFKLKAIFKSVRKEHRLAFLQKAAAKDYGIKLSFKELAAMRRGFDLHKAGHLGLSESAKCYCCDGSATLRHHVQPLLKGGRNKANNIVPLCDPCHRLIHPHMQGAAQGD